MRLLLAAIMDGMPHGYCLLWNRELLWLHAGSDTLIAISYFLIPVSLIRFVRRRRDVPFNIAFISFGAFVLLCGTTHLLGVYNIWVPDWWLTGGVKAMTAVASAFTALLLVRLLPQAIALPSPAQLRDANAQLGQANALLRTEASERAVAQAGLARAHEDAEALVRTRTAELAESNARLAASEARYRALVQASADFVWTASPDGSPADMRAFDDFTGASVPEATVARRDGFLHPEDRAGALAAWETAVRTTTPYQSQHRLLNASGQWRHVRVQAVPVLDSTGAVREWVGAHLDVTEQVESTRQLSVMREQLEQSQRLEAVGRLAGGIAHDFNNLLTVITGASSLVLEDMAPDDPSRRDVEDVVAAGTRAAALTAQLLAYSRKQVLQPRILDVNQVLSDIEPMLRRLIGEDVVIAMSREADLWSVQADPNQLAQVILNLALNARDAMPDGGTITFETEHTSIGSDYVATHLGMQPGDYVMLAVSDTGTGMDDATRSQIFEPFFTTKPIGDGTGLGLATVYGIVRQSGGRIYVYSEPGLGTTFKIYLPRAADDDDDVPLVQDASRQPAIVQGETILLVEDAQDVRDFVTRVLERAGYTVLAADGAEHAVWLLRQDPTRIDLLLSDVVMPRMNGRELADLLSRERPGLPVLFMSGYTDSTIAQHGVLDASTHFLHKPFTPDQLLTGIWRALSGGGSQ